MQSAEKSSVKVDASLQLAQQLKLIALHSSRAAAARCKSRGFYPLMPDSIVIKWQARRSAEVLRRIYFFGN